MIESGIKANPINETAAFSASLESDRKRIPPKREDNEYYRAD
jgi:hypothetical protein